MNKSAVAMATDSAVTVSSERQGFKTFDKANKLFELIKGRPVGFMVYATADLNGLPWETIVKSFRNKNRGLIMPRLENYVNAFREYILQNEALIDPDGEEHLVFENAYSALMPVFRHIRDRHDSCLTTEGKIVMARVRRLIDTAIEAHATVYKAWDDAPWSAAINASTLTARHGKPIQVLVDELFGEYSLGRAAKKGLLELVTTYLLKLPPGANASGLVFAGFGEQEFFPKVYSCRTRGALQRTLLEYDEQEAGVDRDIPGAIFTFAQDNEAAAYITGIDREVREEILNHLAEWVDDSKKTVAAEIRKLVPTLGRSDVQKIANKVSELTHKKLHKFVSHMNDYTDREFLAPLLDSIAVLPKEELADYAESLVNLTSLKQRVDVYTPATVGGAIDVAIISRGEGLVWIKRKHYFSPELNPTWHLRQHATLESGLEAQVTRKKK
jgi:hypothetical protein